MTKLNLHKSETVKEVKVKEMFRCPICHKDAEFSKWKKSMAYPDSSICSNCGYSMKDTLIKKVKS